MAFVDVWMKNISGSLPEFGAIFMSNMKTKEECFSRRLFGLPLGYADFVKRVRAGMVLFLFEYEQRKLYGVFEAISDGGIDTVPQAYLTSGKLFRAQVQFSVTWKCHPLPEHEFRDAIKDNYYAANKFNYGLSKEQVRRLLCLFELTKVRVHKTLARKEKKSWSSSSDEWYGFGGNSKLRVETNDFTVDDSASSRVSHSRGSPNLSCKEPEQENISSINASSFLDRYKPLPSPDHSNHAKAASDNSSLKEKHLYSDSTQIRESAFSRLSLVPETAKKEEKTRSCENNFEADDSVHKIMEQLQQRHDNWRITKKNAAVLGDDNISPKRSSVFSRLIYTLESTVEEERYFNAKLFEPMKNRIKEMSNRKKRNRVCKVVNIRDQDYENSSSNMRTIQVTIQGDGKMSEDRGGSVWFPSEEEEEEEDHKKKKHKRRRSSTVDESDERISERKNNKVKKVVASELERVTRGEESSEEEEKASELERVNRGEESSKKEEKASELERVSRGEESSEEEEKGRGLTNADSDDQFGDQLDGGPTTDYDVVPIFFKTYQQRHRFSASQPCVKYAGRQVVMDVSKMQRFEASCADVEEGEWCADIEEGECCADIKEGECCADIEEGECCTDIEEGECCADIEEGECCTDIEEGEFCPNIEEGECCEQDAEQEIEFFL